MNKKQLAIFCTIFLKLSCSDEQKTKINPPDQNIKMYQFSNVFRTEFKVGSIKEIILHDNIITDPATMKKYENALNAVNFKLIIERDGTIHRVLDISEFHKLFNRELLKLKMESRIGLPVGLGVGAVFGGFTALGFIIHTFLNAR